jgi:CBS domain-containing protein
MENCQEIMTKGVECCFASDKVYTIAQRMQSEHIDGLPALGNHQTKKLIGIVTGRALAVRIVGASRDAINTQASDVMTPNPLIYHPLLDDLDTTLEMMANHQIGRILVVDEDGQVVGIIALSPRLT